MSSSQVTADRRGLPVIDYSAHPAYAAVSSPDLRTRGEALGRFARAAAGQTARRGLALASRRRRRTAAGADTIGGAITTDLRRDGVVTVALASPDREAIDKALSRSHTELSERLAEIEPPKRSYGDGQLTLKRPASPDVFEAVEHALKAAGVLAAASTYLRHPVGVRFITLQINERGETHWRNKFGDVGVPDPATLYMHIDTTPRMTKCLLYLSDVDEASGAFRYAKGSHRLELGALDGLVRSSVDKAGLSARDADSRRRFAALPKTLQRKADFGSDLLDDEPAAVELLAREQPMTGLAGTAVLFDNRGVHRGGMVLEGRREILQIGLG